MSGPRVGVAVPAAGSGRRMGGVRKPFLELAGEPVLLHALRPFLRRDDVVAVVVALGADDAAEPPAWLVGVDARVAVVAGGATRAASVARALAALPADLDVIAVHDAARPLLTDPVLDACVRLAAAGEGAVAGRPAVDTVKEVDGDGRIVRTPDRARLWYAHTPQVFPAAALRRAYAALGGGAGGATGDDRGAGDAIADDGAAGATDDASLVEASGLTVRMVDSAGPNLKVTVPEDVAVAEALLARRRT